MKAQSIVFAVVGVFFGLIVGWIIGTQHATSTSVAPAPVAQQTGAPPAKSVDENQVASLRADIQREPGSAAPRVALGNLYFDAQRFDEAAKWYEEAVKLDPRDPNVSTDLGVAYYYLNQPDRALQQFDQSLRMDPKHTKTLLNQGVVRAYGKQDLEGAVASWQKVIDLVPGSPEAQNAKRMLEDLKSAHPGIGGASPSTPRVQ
jgi:cytochrome c-type biogenesis protein CcmH/NrfG